jgi:hypothetical protein
MISKPNVRNVDDRITAALRSATDRVTEESLRSAVPATASRRHTNRTVRWGAPLLAAAAVVGIAVTVAQVSGGHTVAAPMITPAVSPASSVTVPGLLGEGTNPPPSATVKLQSPTVTPPPPGSYCFFSDIRCKGLDHPDYVPLWPYANFVQASAVEQNILSVRSRPSTLGSGPYIDPALDPGQVALAFTEKYLGFTGITKVTSSVVAKDQARIGVGYLDADGKTITVAVIHLVKYERDIGDQYAPWEVVGTDDTTLGIETPSYRRPVETSVEVGGRIGGPDDNVRVSILHTTGKFGATTMTLTQYCCVLGGGQNSSWSVTLRYPQYAGIQVGDVLTIVASAGGSSKQPERFAIQGVYVAD